MKAASVVCNTLVPSPLTPTRRQLRIASAVALLAAACTISASGQTLAPLWNVDPGSRTYMTTDNSQRGMGYNRVSGNVLVANRAGGISINKVAGATGADAGTLDMTGVSGGVFPLNQVVVAEDGVIYAANLVSPSSPTSQLKIYRWADETAAPTVAYSGEPVGGTRWGDNMNIRGSGNNTQIIMGQGTGGTNVAIFTTADLGVTLTPTVLGLAGINAGDTRGGITFGSGDTYYVRTAGSGPLRYASFDLTGQTTTLTASSTMPAGLNGFGPLGSWPAQNLLGAQQIATTAGSAHNFYLFSIAAPDAPATLDIEPFLNPGNANANVAGSIHFDPANSRVYVLDANNGLRAFTITLPPTISQGPLSQTVNPNDDVLLSVTASGTGDLTYAWRKDGTAIPMATASTLALDDIQVAQEGNYDVIVSNAGGSVTSAVARVSVRHAPVIVAQPQNSTVCEGANAVFTVTASGTPAVWYQWRLSGTDILNETNATLTISNAQVASSGNSYDVVVTNELGTATSTPATLTVNAATTATPLVGVTNACPGAAVAFTTTAGGTGPFTYVWRKDGTEIAGETGATLNLTVTPTSGGSYCVEVTGGCGSVTNCAPLSVATAPAITAQPVNQAAPMGNSATFSVTATETVPLTYQWQRNGSDITGATSPTLTVANVTLAQTGEEYRVIVSNCAGMITSAAATLTVTPIAGVSFDFDSPRQYTNTPYYMVYNDWINVTMPDQLVEVESGGVGGGGALDLVPGGTDNTAVLVPLMYDFSLNGKTLTASAMFKAKAPTANNRSTQIGFVTTPTLGIANTTPQGFMSVILQSTAQPALTYQLRLQHRLTTGGLTEVTPSATTANLTAGNWYKVTAEFVNIEDTAANTFTIAAALQDMGADGTTPGATVLSYAPTNIVNADMVNARNLHLALRGFENNGVDLRDNVYVHTVPGPVHFVVAPEPQTVAQGDRAVFKALVDGDGPYRFQWSKNGTPIPDARNWKYITPPTTMSDSGALYTVEVTSLGAAANTVVSSPATLTVESEPLAVVSAGSVDGCDVGVRFNQPVDRATAENPANYLINGVAPTVARLHTSTLGASGPDGIAVILTPAAALAGPYSVTVQNVRDLAGVAIAAPNNSANGVVEGLTGFDVNPSVTIPAGENYSFGPGDFEVIGGGADIWSNADSFRYVYTQKTGDFDVNVRILGMDVVRGPSKAGLEVRTSLDPFSPQVLAAVNPEMPGRGFYEGTFESTYNIPAGSWGGSPPARYPNAWLRLRRAGNTFLRYSSTNGIDWSLDGQVAPSPAMPETVYFGLAACAVANGNALTAQFDNYGDFAGYPGATIAITTQPVGTATVNAGGSTNLSVTATVTSAPANGELTYVWQRNSGSGWVNLPTAGSTNNVLNTGALFGPDNGALYRVIVKAPGAADVTSGETAIVVNDTGVPAFSSATLPLQSIHNIVLGFSEPMGDSAVNVANYAVTNSVGTSMGVSSATFLSGDRRTVVLTTTSPLVAGTYGVSATTGVMDLGGNAIVATTRNVTQSFTPPLSRVVIDVFTGLSNAPADITVLNVNPKFTQNNPDFILYSNTFGLNHGVAAFPNVLDNYGARIYSHFVPPTNGAYKFYIRGDDFVEFYMNTTGPDRAGAVLQKALTANAASYSAANSVTNTLVAGQRYYIELRYKENTGGDGATLAVRNDNTVPGATEIASANLFAFPDTIAPATPVVVEIYTGQVTLNSQERNEVNAAYGSGGYPDLLASVNTPNFIAGLPNVVGYAKNLGFNFNLNQGNAATFDNYLGRMYGYFVAPSNGLYKFYARSDDSSQLWMNTNAVNSADRAGMVLLGAITDFYDVNYRLMAQNVALVGGQRYYIEGRWRDGGGGDGMTVAVRAQENLTTPPNTEIAPGSLFEFPADLDRIGAVNIAGVSPSNPVVNDGETVTFMAEGISGALPYGMFWLKNGEPIFANATSFTTQPLGSADNGAVFTFVVTNGFSRVERSRTVTVISDSTAPTIVSAVGSQYQDTVVLTFSEAVDEHTACGPAYAINNGVRVLSASYDDVTRRRVTLRTTPQTAGTTYTVTVNGVRDASSTGNTIAANSTVSFTSWIAAGSGVYVEIFTNITGGTVANLTSDSKFINNLADVTFHTNRFGAGLFGADTGLNNYGVRVSGFFSAPSNGLYRFYIRGDDGTQLFMNTNGPDASGRVLIARNDGANSSAFDNGTGGSASPVLSLNAGTLYYIEALMKEGGGGDHLEVAHRAIDPVSLTAVGGVPPVDANQAMVGQFFVNVGNPDTAALTVAQAPSATLNVIANDIVTLEAWAYAPDFALSQASAYQWQRSDGSGGFTNVPGAIGRTFSFQAKASDAGIRLIASGPGTNAVYTTALNVASDARAPVIVAVSTFDGNKVAVTFSEPLTNTMITDQFIYRVDGQPPVTVTAFPDPNADYSTRAIITPTDPLGATFTVEATATDEANNTATSATNGVTGAGFTALDVGAPVAAGFSIGGPDGEIDVIAGGNDIWGNSDVGRLTLARRTGNFDVSVRVAGLTRPDAIAKAGLMVRETLDANSRTLFASVNPSQLQLTTNAAGLPGRDLGEAGRRQSTGGGTAGWLGGVTYNPAAVPNAWIRIKRVGDEFTAMRSYDGVNWLTYAFSTFGYPNTVYVGLATTAHTGTQAPGLVATAEYRDLYVVPGPVILVQPSPPSQTVPPHSAVSYSVVASNPPPNVGPLTYQWFRNGAPIPGATGSTLNIPDATGADNGIYTVDVSNDGGTVTSDPVSLTANTVPVAVADSANTVQNTAINISAASLLANDSDPEGAPLSLIAVSGVFPATFNADFEDGVPDGATTFGVAAALPDGGVNNSGALRINPGSASQSGSLVLDEFAPGRRVTAFNANFKLRVSDVSDEPADGFSFNFGPDLPAAAGAGFGENGVGTGISFCVDNYRFMPYPQGGLANTSGLKVRYRGIDLAGVRTPAWNSSRFVPVSVNVTPDGVLTVLVDGTNVFGDITLPNYLPTAGRFGFYGRTGGQFQSHTIDDVSIATVLTMDTLREMDPATTPVRFGSAYVEGGFLHITDNANSQAGSYIVHDLTPGGAATAFAATFNLRIGNGTGEPADGFSFNYANDLSIAASGPRAAEDGVGSGFSFCVDNYRFAPYPGGGTANTSGIKVRYNGVDIAGVQMPAAWNDPAFVPVSITVATDGTLTVLVDGTNVFGNVVLPSWVPSAGRFGLYGRTGGQNETHWVDDLAINVQTAASPVSFSEDFNVAKNRFSTVVLNGGQVTYTPAENVCGSDSFYYLVSDGQPGGFSIGTVNVQIDEGTPAPPVIIACATNRNLVCAGPLPDMRAEIVAVDNCCCVTVTQNPAPGTMLAHGSSTTVTFTVTDTGGRSANCQATVTVSASTLAITTQPTSQTVYQNTPVSVTIAATGEPTLTYQWYFAGNAIPGATSPEIGTSSAQPENAGDYFVVVTDGCGMSVTSVVATLTVTPCNPVSITTQPANTSVTEGTMATFSVAVSGTEPYTYQWYENNAVISGATSSNYSRVVACNESGRTFHVVVSNPCGQLASQNATLTVVSGPTTLAIVRQGANVVISWPVSCSTFVVDESPSLQPGSIAWTQVTGGTLETVGGQNRLTVPMGSQNRFFRLRRP